MSADNLRLADEFVAMVGADNLLGYLGLPEDVPADAAIQALKERRRYMQGMQSNPKYKQQALFLIKHLSAFEELLSDPPAYLAEVAKRQEQARLPALEATMRGVLRGGRLTQPQIEYLREQADEQGIRKETFEELLTKLSLEQGLPDPFSNDPQVDHYAILGVDPNSNYDEIYAAYRETHREARNTPEPAASRSMKNAADNAWRVLGNCLLYTSPSPRDLSTSRMPSSA